MKKACGRGSIKGWMVTVHGALHLVARHPAGKIAVACIQPVYTPFRSVLNKHRWRLGPPSGDFSMGWMRYSSRPVSCYNIFEQNLRQKTV